MVQFSSGGLPLANGVFFYHLHLKGGQNNTQISAGNYTTVHFTRQHYLPRKVSHFIIGKAKDVYLCIKFSM